ncbi:hypothetical protein SO802_027666 [Lithocarpus litseifolius]|uniref:DUF4283 domain-containing protein n=1 Tax=Lithocarpus litseifolius TaxID=425828 RepID=A0AAW2C4U5_9ROSI
MAVTCGMEAVFDVFSLGVEMPIGASKWTYGFWVCQNGTGEWVLVAKFLTRRVLNLDTIAKTFSPLWRATKGFKVRKEGEHIVLFTFKDQLDMMRVPVGEPWSFDKYLVAMQELDGTKDVRDMKFDQSTLWVQVHDLPLRFRNRMVAEQLCEALGTVNRGVDESAMVGDRFVRVRVTLNISNPLCKGRVITLDDGKDLWIPFKYELLTNLCYRCGCLSHDERNCEIWSASEGNLDDESPQYGPWIKATPFVPSKSKMVTIPGISELRKNAIPPSNPKQGSKLPVVVLRSDNPSPKVIWPENQGKISNPPVLGEPVFQQTNLALSEESQSDKTEVGYVYASAVALEDVAEAGKSFEVTLEALNKEIEKFDHTPIANAEILIPLGPLKTGPTNLTPHPNPISPLANITNSSPSQAKPTPNISPKWTRIKRQVGLNEDYADLNAALGKRVALLPHSDSKPSKRRITYSSDQKENINSMVEAVSIKVVGSSLNFIDAIVNDGQENPWRFTGIYGFSESRRKLETWHLLCEFNNKYNLPWVCAGDFNEILRGHEKLGGAPRREVEMEAFRDVVDELGFVDLRFTGKKFTWIGKRGEAMILERLDRAFATLAWLELFPATQGFPSYESNMILASSKIKLCGKKLVEWSRTSFRSVKRQIAEVSKALVLAEEAAAGGGSFDQVRALKLEINELLDKESMMWIQRARAMYLQLGNNNTRFFHNRASQRYKRNRIHGLKNN